MAFCWIHRYGNISETITISVYPTSNNVWKNKTGTQGENSPLVNSREAMKGVRGKNLVPLPLPLLLAFSPYKGRYRDLYVSLNGHLYNTVTCCCFLPLSLIAMDMKRQNCQKRHADPWHAFHVCMCSSAQFWYLKSNSSAATVEMNLPQQHFVSVFYSWLSLRPFSRLILCG